MTPGSLDLLSAKDYNGNMVQVNVSLPVDLQHYVDTRVAAEGYADPSDFLRDAVARDRSAYEADVRRVRALIREGRESGMVDAEPEDVLAAIIAEIPAGHG